MKKTIIGILTLSICFGGDNLPAELKNIKDALQKKYQIYSLDDLYKLENPSQSSHRTASRDMEDLVGDWMLEEEAMELFVTVGSDQSITDPFSAMGLVEAEGSVTATASDFETDLNYLIIGIFDDEGPDCNMNCEDEYNDYNDYGMEPSDIYCECCQEDWHLEDICEDGGDNLNLEFEGIADMNYARYGAAYATDGNMVYAICGADWDSEDESTVYHTHGERYNPGDDSWEMFGENLLQRRYTTAEYVNGSIYVFNGYNGNSASDTVEIINTTTGEVTYSATNPYPVWYGGSAVWNDKIYIFGGNNGSEVSNRLYEFDPTDESWTRLADMPDSMQTNGQVVNGILYTLGGYNGSAASSHINAYDIEQNTWETVGDMSVGISAHSVATDGELIFVLGDYSDIEFCGVYDPFEGEFFELESNMAGRRHSASVFLDGEIYAYGGSQPEGFNGNEDYVVLSSAERAELTGNDGEEPPTPENFLDWFDANGDSVLTLEEIIDGINDSNIVSDEPPLSAEDEDYIESAFNDSDENGDGVLNLDELENFIYMLEDNDDDGDDFFAEVIITNLNLIEFFMAMFGIDSDILGVDNPMVVGATSTLTENGAVVLDEVFSMILDGEMDGPSAIADSAEAVAATSLDTVENTITFTSLSLYDSNGAAVLTLSGTIGPGMLDFVAGEEMAFPFLEGMEDMFEEDDDYEFYMSFYEDSTGMEIEAEYWDDEYNNDEPEIHLDTSYFNWYATLDSLILYEESDDYYDQVDTTELAYFIDGDTLAMEASFDPCEDEDSFEECIEFASEEIAGLDELEDIESLRLSMERVLTSTELASVGSATILGVSDVPDDQGGRVYVTFARSIHDTDNLRTPEMYTVERLDGDTWVGLNSVSAYGNDVYVVEATTLADSTSETDALMTYRIIAAMEEGNFTSDPMSGYSVDNIAPNAPASVVAAVSGGVVYLEWADSDANDLDYYAVYRSTDSEFVLGEENMIGSSEGPEFADDVEELGDYYYAVTTLDVHENESDPSELVNVTLLNLEDIRGLPEVFTLHQNYPNPFNPNTQIQYALPTDANVSIAIYDLVGRKIRTLVNEQVKAGYHFTLWNATNDMGSPVSAGVYIYTITANDFRDVKKMILLK